jgi:MFS family permease
MGQSAVAELPRPLESPTRTGVAGLFADGRALGTVLLWLAMILGYAALWFAISWIPKLAIMAGLDRANATYAGTSFNAGAFLGTVALGLITARVRLQVMIAVFLALAAVAMIVFGMANLTVATAILLAFAIGFFLQGGFNGIYPLGTQLYPAEIRGTGIGWTMGIGRIGAVLGPLVGGLLIKHEVPIALIFLAFAVPAALGGACAAFVSTDAAQSRRRLRSA